MTYNQIAEKHKIPKNYLTKAVSALKIKGVFINGSVNFSPKQVKEIISYRTKGYSNKKYNRRKLRIIELYQKFKSANKVSTFFSFDRKFVLDAVKEYNSTGYCIVESKMNNE